ncbi:hypothetical protein Bca52824_087116 [Brassica carinata]|uniref:Uncharacterized protein n=1 Tax=Brassica carinata TaxID=52824 RepID=A0A8X7PB53_BRACI|nr:hypothetical protein Bca52824_087116 [Brassica carinata]
MPLRIIITYTKLHNCDVDLRYMKSGIQEPPLEKFIPKRNRLFDEFVRDLDHLSTIYNFNMNFIAYQNLLVFCPLSPAVEVPPSGEAEPPVVTPLMH